MRDIQTAGDLDALVARFYSQVLQDPIIGFIFTDIARLDLEEHLPKISAFWQWQLLGIPGYAGRPFETHLTLHEQVKLTSDHFHRWRYLFNQAVDQLFQGPIADAAKIRAEKIANSMQQALHNRAQSESWRQQEAAGVQLFVPA